MSNIITFYEQNTKEKFIEFIKTYKFKYGELYNMKTDYNIIKLILEHNKKSKLDTHNTGLMALRAIGNGNLNMLKMLIEHGAKNYNSLFVHACEYLKLDIIQYLLNIDKNIEINHGLCNVCKLCTDNEDICEKIIDYLINEGADNINEALNGAIDSRNIRITTFLIKKGACDLNDALLHAVRVNSRQEMIKLLIDSGAYNIKEALRYTYDNRRRDCFMAILNSTENLF